MKILVVLSHPTPGSFNHAIAAVTCEALRENGHRVMFHDLYQEQFDPVLPREEIPADGTLPPLIAHHCTEVREADGIVIIHPNWWGQPPAMMKGWIDRVLRPGVAYRFIDGDAGDGVPVGLLTARAAIVFNTSNTPVDREQDSFGDPLEMIWKRCIFDLCGIRTFCRRTFSVIITSSLTQRRHWLNEVRDIVVDLFAQSEVMDTDGLD